MPLPCPVTPALEAFAELIGTPYRVGGTEPASGLDCYGLVRWIYAQCGAPLPEDWKAVRRGFHPATRPRFGDVLLLRGEGPLRRHLGVMLAWPWFLHAGPAEITGGVARSSAVRAPWAQQLRQVVRCG